MQFVLLDGVFETELPSTFFVKLYFDFYARE